ncbi:unnamed protein product, partial [Nesidiocoris tenuis]
MTTEGVQGPPTNTLDRNTWNLRSRITRISSVPKLFVYWILSSPEFLNVGSHNFEDLTSMLHLNIRIKRRRLNYYWQAKGVERHGRRIANDLS